MQEGVVLIDYAEGDHGPSHDGEIIYASSSA